MASHQDGDYIVTIYNGAGENASTSTGSAPMPLATITDPLGPGIGPLDVAVGDFTGAGVSDLAISSTGTGLAGSSKVAVYTFRLDDSTPMNSPVTPVLLGKPFVPPGIGRTNGLSLAAADTNGDGAAQLIVAPAHGGSNQIAILSYSTASQSWQPISKIGNVPLPAGGMSIDAGQIAGDGSTEIVAGSHVSGVVAVYDTSLGRWVWTSKPLAQPPPVFAWPRSRPLGPRAQLSLPPLRIAVGPRRLWCPGMAPGRCGFSLPRLQARARSWPSRAATFTSGARSRT